MKVVGLWVFSSFFLLLCNLYEMVMMCLRFITGMYVPNNRVLVSFWSVFSRLVLFFSFCSFCFVVENWFVLCFRSLTKLKHKSCPPLWLLKCNQHFWGLRQ